MRVKVFQGKNWKLASDKKWVEADLDERPDSGYVGVKSFDDEYNSFSVYEIDGNFIAIEDAVSVRKYPRYVVQAAGGAIRYGLLDLEEAKLALKETCKNLKTLGDVWLLEENTPAKKVFSYKYKLQQ